MRRFSSNQIVVMVACVSAAVVLAPVGVMAATGQLVNIVDPVLGNRKVRVGSGGTMHVESRAGVATHQLSGEWTTNYVTGHKLGEATGPERIAVTEVTLSSHGPVSGTTYGHNYVDVVAYVQTTGTGTCGTIGLAGYTRTRLRRLLVRNLEQTVQAQWNGPALVAPGAATGKRSCVMLEVNSISTDTDIYIGATGYRFV